MPDVDSSATAGLEVRGYRRGPLSTDGWDQYVIPVQDRIVSFQGRANTFRTPGRAGTTGQKIATLMNAGGSPVIVALDQVRLDVYMTVVKAVTVAPPIMRLHRITATPTGGAALPKVPMDSALSSSASVVLLQDASADGTVAGTVLAVAPAANSMLTQEIAPRLITAAGYEMMDRTEWFVDEEVTLRAGEGVVIEVAYVLATQNPVTDMWVAGFSWREYTRP